MLGRNDESAPTFPVDQEGGGAVSCRGTGGRSAAARVRTCQPVQVDGIRDSVSEGSDGHEDFGRQDHGVQLGKG